MGFRSEHKFWKFMKSIMPSEHWEMIGLQEEASPVPDQQTGQGSRNDYTNNMGQFIFSQQGNQPTKSTQLGSEKTKQGSGRCPPPKTSFNTGTSLNNEQVTQNHRL